MGAGPSREGLAPSAVKFGALGESGALNAVALVRAKTQSSNGPVVVSVSRDNVELYNAITGGCCVCDK
jgi:hypothetical protein